MPCQLAHPSLSTVNVIPNPTRGDQPKSAKGISWARPSSRPSTAGLLGLPLLSPSKASASAVDDTDRAWSVRRWKGLVSNSLRQMQKEGWRAKVRLGRSGASASVQSRLAQSGIDLLSALWIVEPESHHTKHGPREGDHLRTASSVGGASGPRSSGARPAQLSRTGYVVLLCLFLLGLREVFSLSTPKRIPHNSIKIGRGRDPFAVLRDFAPATSRAAAQGLPGHDRIWKTDLAAVDPVVAGEQGDTTAIVLHWKRTDNVEVIVAHLCQYSFFLHVTVWNNNPDVFLTREVSQIPVVLLSPFALPR